MTNLGASVGWGLAIAGSLLAGALAAVLLRLPERIAAATVVGGTVLAEASPGLVGTAEAVAAGAVLAVVSIAIVPYAFAEVSSRVATATVLGFVAGYLLS